MARVLGVLLTGVALTAGCHRPLQPVEPTSQRVALAGDAELDRVWTAGQEVLREHRFPLARVDARQRMVSTFPVTSQSFFEFWRHDVDTSFDLWESTLRTVRRSAEVRVDHEADAPEAEVTVTVRKEMFATPERQFNNSASSLRIFGDELPGVSGDRQLTHQDDYWIEAGRDRAMERRLLDLILQRAGLAIQDED